MGLFTIISDTNRTDFDALVVNIQLEAGGAINSKYTVRLTDGLANTSNILNVNVPFNFQIVQPFVFNPSGFNPDTLTVSSVMLNLGMGATGTLTAFDGDNITPITLPDTFPISMGSSTSQYNIGIDGFTSGTTDTEIIIGIQATDSTTNQSVIKSARINFLN